jgi:hypothetical protein
MVKIIFSEHVLFEMERRKLDRKEIEHIIQFPDQEILAKKGRVVRQGLFLDKNENKKMILRVIGEKLEDSFYVITAYKSSNLKKYWKGEINEADI